MAADTDDLVLSISADVRQMQRALKKITDDTGRSTRQIERRFDDMGKRVNSSIAGMARGAAASFAAALSVRGVQQFIDAATRIDNSLKVAGLSGAELTKVYDRLFASAQKNAAPLESLVELYGRVALVQNELGISQEELLGFTDKIGVALRVSGKSAQEAGGALLQLSQALGSGIVRAEEFNSILEGALPIAQAAAAGLEEAGGSVAKLRQLVVDGAVSSEAFFRAFEAGSVILEEKVAGAELTVSQRFIRLQNVLIDAAGKFDDVTGASTKVGEGIDKLAGIVRGLSEVFDAAAKGPIGTFIEKLSQLNNLLTKFEPLSRAFGMLSEQNLGNLADMIRPGLSESSIQDWARRTGQVPGVRAPTQGRLPAAPKAATVNTVSLADYAVADAEKAAKATEKAAKSAQRLAEQATKRLNASIASQTAVAVDAAGALLGKHEKKNTGDINAFLRAGGVDLNAATTRWCAAFVNSALAQVGVTGSGSNVATDFLNWGVKVDPSQIQRGDVLVDPNGRSAGQTGGHVGMATGQVRFQEGILQVQMLSGNASNQVQEDWVNASEVVARRATEAVQVNADALDHITDQSTAALQEQQDALKAQEQAYEQLGQIAQTALQGLATALADGKLEGEELLQILMQVVQQLLTMPSLGGIGGGGGGLGGILSGILGGIFHSGGTVGGASLKRTVHPATFVGAPRMHSGGVAGIKPGEVPAILQRGEIVLPRGAKAGRAGGQQQAVHVTVGVSADNNGNLLPFVESVSQKTSAKITQAGIGQYDRQLNKTMGGKIAQAQARQM